MIRTARRAFTLIELLVVVTIIVVLLALLTPALDKAVYQAELVKCGAHQKGVANGVQLYSVDQKRFYPDRPSLRAVSNEAPYLGRIQNADDRPLIMPYFSMKILLCPLAGGNNIDLSIEANDPETYVYSSYALFFGWGYPKLRAMRKLGDRFEWAEDNFSTLVADHDSDRAGTTQAAHPDEQGLSKLTVAQNFDPFGAGGIDAGALGKVTVSWWTGTPRRRPIERNVAYDDGSVERFNGLKWEDSRMKLVPDYNNNGKAGWFEQLPGK